MKDLASLAVDYGLLNDMTVREVERADYAIREKGGIEKAGYEKGVGVAILTLWDSLRHYRFTEKAAQMKVCDFLELKNNVHASFILQYIANHFAYTCIVEFYDWLESKRMKNHGVEKYWRKLKRAYNEYEKAHKKMMDEKSWILFLDHMSICYDTIEKEREELENAVRDYLIQHRKDIYDTKQKDDIALLQKVAMCFIFLTTMQTNYRDYFTSVIEKYGVDFSYDFRFADIPQMMLNTMYMCEQLGVRFSKVEDGTTVLLGVNVNSSVRIMGVWQAMQKRMFSEEFVEETALQAIDYNPDVKKDYEARMERREQEAMEESIDRLNEKYFVKHESK